MPRTLDTATSLALASGSDLYPFFAVQITFASATYYLWSGAWPLSWNNQTWTGTGDLGKIGSIAESGDIVANGTTVTLNGVDQTILQECLDDVQLGAPCTIYFGLLSPGTMTPTGTPYPIYSGLVDQPNISYGLADCSITVNIESHMLRLASGSQRKYTSADQRLRFPTDTMFARVETLNDLALRFGS